MTADAIAMNTTPPPTWLSAISSSFTLLSLSRSPPRSYGISQAVRAGKPTVLEPIMNLEVRPRRVMSIYILS